MKFTVTAATLAMTALTGMGLAAPALAQESAVPAAPAAAAAPSDETLNKFAKAILGIQDLEKQGKGSDQAALAGVLKDVGLPIEDYNAITTTMAKDKALNDRVQAAYKTVYLARQQSAAPSTAPATN